MAKRGGLVGKEWDIGTTETPLKTLFGFHDNFSVTVTITFMVR
ncbi:hypothetical protein CCACVL1_10668 [Corchorus capsularis]|uniref:Uncharacterized protein n=1 Tax=Corchorus capsularis TaxID=210143 RepID=A0A1R3IQ99_COCAP|nr:hypothetical protein CCACVL1_10668 [Corchorus capsularis]